MSASVPRRVVRVTWAPLLAALAAVLCTQIVIDRRHDASAHEGLDERADVVATAVATIERDAERAAVAIDGAASLPDVGPHLRSIIDRVLEHPSLVTAITLTDDRGTIIVTNRASDAIERALGAARPAPIPRAPSTKLVTAIREPTRDVLVFASATSGAVTQIMIELTIDRAAFTDLPRGTAFVVDADGDPFGPGELVRTDAAISGATTSRSLQIGGVPATLTVSGEETHAIEDAWAALVLAALSAAVATMTVQSAVRRHRERRAIHHDDELLDGALVHQQRVEADLRVSATHLRAVLDSTPDTVAVLEPVSRRLRLLNRTELFGHEATRFEDDGFVHSIVIDDAEFRLWWAALALTPLDAHPEICFWATAANGDRRRAQLRVAPLRGAGLGMQHRCVAVFTDITDQHEQRTREQMMRDELERARHLESLGRLAGGIAHDFRNVLAAVDMNADLLAARADHDTSRHLDVIRRATGRASEMVQQLLAFAKRDLAESILLDLNDAVRDLEAVIRSAIPATITLDFAVDPRPCPTRAAPGQIDRIILNLACNARDALPRGGTIRIATAHECGTRHPGGEGRWVALVVTDDGIGIADDVIDKVFEPFFTTKGDAGSGLGLASVHGIVTALGGHIAIKSALGSGTTVTITLPAGVGESLPVRHRPRALSGGVRRVVLVDHDGDQRAPTARLLRERGFDVVEAENASDGLAAMARCAPDVLVTDLVIPGAMNGLELATRAKREHPGVSVLVVSGYADAVIADGSPIPHRIIRKPLSAEELTDALDALRATNDA